MREELELGVDVPSCEGGVEVVVELFRVDGEGRDVRGTDECVKVVGRKLLGEYRSIEGAQGARRFVAGQGARMQACCVYLRLGPTVQSIAWKINTIGWSRGSR